MVDSESTVVNFKQTVDRIPKHRSIKKGLMKVIMELGFNVKPVSLKYSS